MKVSTTKQTSAPQITYVYRFYNAEDELLYVGIAKGIEARFRQHAKDKPWFNEVARSEAERCMTLPVALAKEATAILSENPKYNRSIPTMKRHDLLNERAGTDPDDALTMIQRLKSAEDANRRHAMVIGENERMHRRVAFLKEQLAEERESGFIARADAVKLTHGAREAMGLLRQAEADAALLRKQLLEAQNAAAGLKQELKEERSTPVLSRAFSRLRGVPVAAA